RFLSFKKTLSFPASSAERCEGREPRGPDSAPSPLGSLPSHRRYASMFAGNDKMRRLGEPNLRRRAHAPAPCGGELVDGEAERGRQARRKVRGDVAAGI